VLIMQGTRGLAKVAVQCSAETFVVKIGIFTKPETMISDTKKRKIITNENQFCDCLN